MNKIYNYVFVIILIFSSCSEDYLDLKPSTSQSEESITSLSEIDMLLYGAYNILSSNDYYNNSFLSRNDVRADDMLSLSSSRLGRENGYLYTPESCQSGMWSRPYAIIRQANKILKHLKTIELVSENDIAKANDIKGQILTIRALAHFDLCRMFALPYSHNGGNSLGVPIITSALGWNIKVKRNTVFEVYTQIITDLITAIPLLKTDKTNGYINHWAAKTLLSRVYLYMEDNKKAYNTAKDIIDNSPYYLIPRDKYIDSWSEDFTSESIFSIANTITDNGGLESIGNYGDPDGYYIFAATKKFTLILKDTDIRKKLLFNDYKTSKYNIKGRVLKFPGKGNKKSIITAAWNDEAVLTNPAYTSNTPIFRLSEVYLIAAEAAFKYKDITKATLYLNSIVQRADPMARVSEKDIDLNRILLERRKELISEGHRFFDLTRNKKNIDRPRLTKRQSYTVPVFIEWNDYRIVYPIPVAETNANKNIIQNSGYTD